MSNMYPGGRQHQNWHLHIYDAVNDRMGRMPAAGYATQEEAMRAAYPFLSRPEKTFSHISGPDGQHVSVIEVANFCRSFNC
jgi:hypothetical protein